MRLVPAMLVLASCGIDVRTMPQDSEHPDVDAGTTTAGTDAGRPITTSDGGTPDGIPANLTPCEAAVYHSDLAWIQANVFSVSCTNMCHKTAHPSASLLLEPGHSHHSLVNVASTTHAGWTRVVPGNPGASMLMVQIGGEPGPVLEGFMPWGQPKLCVEKIDAIRRWIALGAPAQ